MMKNQLSDMNPFKKSTRPIPAVPEKLSDDGAWMQVSVKQAKICGIKVDHTLWCLGPNGEVQQDSATDWKTVSTTEGLGVCGLKQDGMAWCAVKSGDPCSWVTQKCTYPTDYSHPITELALPW